MKTLSILLPLTLLFSQELEVEGNLKVTGGIDASGNTITNVGNPVNATDAVNMQTIDGLAGMKPERIYSVSIEGLSVTVPEDKMWRIVAVPTSEYNTSYFYLNGRKIMCNNSVGLVELCGLPNMELSATGGVSQYLTIYEYSISGSGTDQGMDYVEP